MHANLLVSVIGMKSFSFPVTDILKVTAFTLSDLTLAFNHAATMNSNTMVKKIVQEVAEHSAGQLDPSIS